MRQSRTPLAKGGPLPVSTYPIPEQIKEFLSGTQDHPVVMLNLLRFKTRVDASHGGESGEQAHMRYGREMRGLVEAHDGRFMWAGRGGSALIGGGGEGFQFVSPIEYPSRQAFLKLARGRPSRSTTDKLRGGGLASQWLF